MQFRANLTFDAASPEEAAQKLLAGLHLADIDSDTLKIEQVATGGEVFSYPFSQKLIRHLTEPRDAGEGDYQLKPGEAGGDL
jgi:hypothetical protein